jgi:hypothetical protein
MVKVGYTVNLKRSETYVGIVVRFLVIYYFYLDWFRTQFL